MATMYKIILSSILALFDEFMFDFTNKLLLPFYIDGMSLKGPYDKWSYLTEHKN
jgi:hypothetical protein